MTANYVTAYTNELGQTRYQPTLPGGERLWAFSAWGFNLRAWDDYKGHGCEPVLYKRERQARRIAEREELRRRSVFREA